MVLSLALVGVREQGGLMRRLTALSVSLAATLLLMLPVGARAEGLISSLSVDPSTVSGGASSTGTVTLAFADPQPTTAQLFSSDPDVASVPQQVIVPAGSTSATFTITTNAAAPPTIVTITAAIQNTPRTANLSVNPATPDGNTLSAVSVTPSTITGGASGTGTVTFTGPMPDGANVRLSSSNPAVASVPAETVVSANASTGTFNVSTAAVAANTAVTVTANWFSVTRSTTFTVAPGTPPAADQVAIQKARCKISPPGCLLQVEATSTNPNAILSVYSETGALLFELTNNGDGKFSGSKGFITKPNRIEVGSNFGGSAFATVTS
jgi:hypothetical protein